MSTTQKPEALRLAEQLRDMCSRFKTPSHERGVVNGAIQELHRQHARIAELESQLSAIGAGGVEPLRKPAAQDEALRAELAEETEAADNWRRLALQFDNHRMQALGHLRQLVRIDDGYADAQAAEQFLAAPPLDGEEVLAQRIAALAATQPAAQGMDKVTLLSKDHTGMKVDYSGLLGQVRREIKRSAPGLAEMIRQLQEHMQELGQRWYEGDTDAVDELLQLYCVERKARAALAAKAKQGERP